MTNITEEHDQDDAAAAAAQPDEAPMLSLTPEQAAFDAETQQRFVAAEARLVELSRELPGDQAFGIPPVVQTDAALNLILEILQERGIVAPLELLARKRRHVALLAEEIVAQAEAHIAGQSKLVSPDGAPLPRVHPRSAPPNSRERKRR